MESLDKTAINWAIKGEGAFYLCWKEEYYQQTTEVSNEYINEEGDLVSETVKVREDVPTFMGVDVKEIDPHNLFFDKSQRNDWNNCKKIYRDFVPLEEILANKSYNLTPDEKKELRELVNKQDNDIDTFDGKPCDENTKIYRGTIEVLEFEGTYTLPDSTETLRRMEATVIAGKYLAKFQESDKPQSPYVWAAYMERPDTGRGQSPLKIPSILNSVQNMCMDLVMRCYFLISNPPFLAPDGAFVQDIKVEPGKPIYYNNMDLTQAPQRLDFSQGLSGYQMIDFFRQKAQNATGVNQYMQGSMDSSVRTASEASYIHAGASMRIAREAYKFSHNLIYKLVRLFALYKKVFDTTDRQVKDENGNFVNIDAEVRSGNYKFIIGGAQSVVSREGETQKIFQLLGLPGIQTITQAITPDAAAELLKWAMNRLNLQGTEQISEMLDMNTQLREFAQSNGIPDKEIPSYQEDIKNYIQGMIPQLSIDLANQKTTTPNVKRR